jgi:hypothetical protein
MESSTKSRGGSEQWGDSQSRQTVVVASNWSLSQNANKDIAYLI